MEWTRINEVALLMCVTPGPASRPWWRTVQEVSTEVFTGEKDLINLSGEGWL